MLNLEIAHDQLAAPLRRVAAVADPRSPVPAYGAIKLVSDEFGLSLTAANSVQLLVERIDMPDLDAGLAYVSAARLRDLVGSFDRTQPVKISEDTQIKLQSGRTRARLERISSTGFPTALSSYPAPQIETTTDELARALHLILPAVGSDKDRAIYGSACMFGNSVGVWLAAVDGVQGAIAHLGDADTVEKFPDAMLPRATVTRLLGLAKSTPDTPLYIAIGKGIAQFTAGDWTLSSRLAAVDFPDAELWVAPAVAQPVVLVADNLERILARIDAGLDMDNVKLKQRGAELSCLAGSMTVSGNQQIVVEEMPVEMGNEPIKAGVNTRQLRHCLHAIGAERVELHIGERVIRVCAVGEELESYTLSLYRL